MREAAPAALTVGQAACRAAAARGCCCSPPSSSSAEDSSVVEPPRRPAPEARSATSDLDRVPCLGRRRLALCGSGAGGDNVREGRACLRREARWAERPRSGSTGGAETMGDGSETLGFVAPGRPLGLVAPARGRAPSRSCCCSDDKSGRRRVLSSVASSSGAGDGPLDLVGPLGGAVARADDRRRREDVGRGVDRDAMKMKSV